MFEPSFLATLPPSADCLRANQRSLIHDIHGALTAGHTRILAQADTAFGKTHVMSVITAAAVDSEMRALIIVTRTRLALQVHERFERFGIPHGVVAAALPDLRWPAAPVQIAMADTLHRRSIVDARMPLPSADVVIFDEAHLSLGESRLRILGQYPKAIRIGFTATPAKISGRSLREGYDTLICGPTTKSLIASGDLVRPRIFSAPAVTSTELAAVRKDSKSGDFATGELSQLMSRPKLVGDVVQNWLRIANGKPSIVFACDKAHGAALAQEFRQAGVAAELLTDQDSEPDREASIYRLEHGRTKIIINCFLLSYGIDIPAVECIVLARPTRSIVLYRQAIGRGMRPAPGKDHVIVIDHGRVVENLGMPDEPIFWSLDDCNNVNRSTAKRVAERKLSKESPRICPECAHMWLVSEDGNACDCCGWAPAPAPKKVRVQDADLVEVGAVRPDYADDDVHRFFAEALRYYAQRWPAKWEEKPNRGRWWAWMNAREKFQLKIEKPPSNYWRTMPGALTPRTAGWIKSRQIARARRQHA
jgi:superfamily II DNA or RNA helicase